MLVRPADVGFTDSESAEKAGFVDIEARIAEYRAFLARKCKLSADFGFEIDPADIHPWLKPHAKALVPWAARGGRRAIFARFGLHKTSIQLELLRLILKKVGGRGLITAPLGVRQEFKHDAGMLDIDLRFIRSIEEADETGLYFTNYETVRDGKLDPKHFSVASLDEAAVLRGFGGTKIFREFMRLFETVPLRFVATATPDPNEFIELLAYAAFLGVMDVGEAKTRFFKRDSTNADRLTIHPHKEREFWMWVSSWAIFLQAPSDLGFSDDGYALPEMVVHYHEVSVDHTDAPPERNGQGRLYREARHGVVDAAKEKRDSMPQRIAEMERILAEEPEEHFLLWHDLEPERLAIEATVPNVVSVYGKQRSEPGGLDRQEEALMRFSNGDLQYLAAKPVMFGSGCNFQRHCARAIFVGIGFKFKDFIQAVHRIYRFLQTRVVHIYLIYAESERGVLDDLKAKWNRYIEKAERMSQIIREYGLSHAAMIGALQRSMGVERVEVSATTHTLVNNDTVEETMRMEANSVHLIVTSIPFSTQYEYTPSLNDFGHSEKNEHFFEQMDFLTPELLRVLQPGRDALIHVKDRIVPGGMTGLGFQTVYPFHARCIDHFTKHGFAFLGMKTVVTDVVRENKQTKRLGWSEQCKDGSRMGWGLPEYLLLFRKPPSDASNGYADVPVVKQKPECVTEDGEIVPFDRDLPILPGTGYSRSRWQIDAHGFTRSSGNRLLTPQNLWNLPHEAIFKLFRKFSLEQVYDFEHHVKLGESLEMRGLLPVTFMLLQPQSWHPDVWTDITRMLTLNGAQSAKGKEMHLCPIQFDLADRAIAQHSMEGETVFDPFAGLMSVPFRAVKMKRRGVGIELNHAYFLDGCGYVEAAARQIGMPTLFDLEDEPERIPPALDTASAEQFSTVQTKKEA